MAGGVQVLGLPAKPREGQARGAARPRPRLGRSRPRSSACAPSRVRRGTAATALSWPPPCLTGVSHFTVPNTHARRGFCGACFCVSTRRSQRRRYSFGRSEAGTVGARLLEAGELRDPRLDERGIRVRGLLELVDGGAKPLLDLGPRRALALGGVHPVPRRPPEAEAPPVVRPRGERSAGLVREGGHLLDQRLQPLAVVRVGGLADLGREPDDLLVRSRGRRRRGGGRRPRSGAGGKSETGRREREPSSPTHPVTLHFSPATCHRESPRLRASDGIRHRVVLTREAIRRKEAIWR